jgi:CubicO group peptidase (beta-lactamase class C family)
VKTAAALGALALAALPAAGQTPLRERTTEIVQGLMREQGLPSVAVGVVDHGKTFRFTYGHPERDGNRRVDDRTEYEIGSVTKVFTATLLALYVQRGLVALDDPLQKWVPPNVRVPSFDGRAITLEDLATHTAGLPDDPPMDGIEHYRDEDMWRFLDGYRLTRAPGTKWEYSNLGFALLGHALQRAAGGRWPELIRRDVCAPLGLSDTAVDLSPEQRERLAQGYGAKGEHAAAAMRTWPAFWSAGALRSNLVDMTRFVQYNLGLLDTPLHDLLPALQQVRKPAEGRMQMALGWQTLPNMPEKGIPARVFFKNGGTNGFHAFVAFVPETKTGVVLLTNKAYRLDSDAFELLGFLHRATASAP